MGYVAISLSLAFLMAPLLGGVVFAEQGYEAVFAMAWGLLGVDIFLRLILIERKFARGWLRNCGSHNDTVVAAGPGQEDREEVAINSDEKANQEKNTNTNPQEKSLAQNHPFQSLGTPASAHTADPRAASPHPTPRPFTPPGAVVLPPRNITLDPPPFSLLNLILPSRRSKPLPPLLQLCTSPRLLVALYSTAIQGALITSLDSTLPIYVRQLFGWDSLGAGLVFLPLVLPSFLSPVVGWLTDRYGPRWLTTIGFLLGMPFLVALRVVDEDGLQMKIALCGLLAGLGVALAMVLPPVMAEISYVVDAMEREKPGLFGSRGAYAQAVSSDSPPRSSCVVSGKTQAYGNASMTTVRPLQHGLRGGDPHRPHLGRHGQDAHRLGGHGLDARLAERDDDRARGAALRRVDRGYHEEETERRAKG